MNDNIVNQAIAQLSDKRQQKIFEQKKRIAQIEQEIPEIAQLNAKLNNANREIMMAIFTKNIDFQSKMKEIEFNNIQTQQKIAELLSKNGHPQDYLQINYDCEKCRDTGFLKDENGLEVNEYCSCLLDLVKSLRTKEINKHSNLTMFSFDTFDCERYSSTELLPNSTTNIRSYMRNMLTTLKNYANNFTLDINNPNKNPSNILMYGKTGLGKTHLSMSIAKIVIDKGFNVIYDTSNSLFSKISDEHFNRDYNLGNSSHETLDTIINTDLLIIDDLGTEIMNRFYTSVLYTIINTRYMKSLPVIINTNLNLKELENHYDERILSRILSYENIVFYGNDFRATNPDRTLMEEYCKLKKNN